MGNSNKKKATKAADFQKTKLKLGKGKLVSQNATNTKVAAKSITLPSQSLDVDNTGVPTTKRNHTFEDLLAQVNHYAVSTKKDGLMGLKEIFTLYPSILSSSAGSTLRTCVPLMTHADSAVRKAFLAFLDWYLILLDESAAPFHTLLVFHTTSALTHIQPETRADGVRALDILLAAFPEAITQGWNVSLNDASNHGHRILECYMALLHVKGTAGGSAAAGSSAQLSPAMRALSLKSLAAFLRSALANTKKEGDDWFFSSAFSTPRAFSVYQQRRSVRHARHADTLQNGLRPPVEQIFPSPLLDMETSLADLTDPSQEHGSSASKLLDILLPTLLAAFLDSAPTALGPETTPSLNDIHFQTISSVIEITLLLLRSNTSQAKDLQRLLKAIHPYFPFERSTVLNDVHVALLGLSLAYCEIVSLVKVGNKGKGLAMQESVAEYITESLQAGSSPDILEQQRFTAESFSALQPSLWTLLDSGDKETTSTTFVALLKFYAQTSLASELKAVVMRFVADCVLVTHQPGYTSSFSLQHLSEEGSTLFAAWIASLPRTLWEASMGKKNPDLIIAILDFLQMAASSVPISTAMQDPAFADALTKLLITQSPRTGKLASPFAAMPRTEQRIARSLVEYIAASIDSQSSQAMAKAVYGAVGIVQDRLAAATAKAIGQN